jgi:hypothetical protein
LYLPDVDVFFQSNAAAVLPNISKMLRTVTKQKLVSQWAQQNDPLLKHVQEVCQGDPALRARMNHLAECEVKGSHPRFDIPTKQSIWFRPTAFMGNLLAMLTTDFSLFQLGQYLQLVLGLDFLPPSTPDGQCPCGRQHDSTGYHRLNCSRWAGRSWAQGHNLVVAALASENRRLGLAVVDLDAAMRRQCTHLTSQARADILVRTNELAITDRVQGHGSARKQFVIGNKYKSSEIFGIPKIVPKFVSEFRKLFPIVPNGDILSSERSPRGNAFSGHPERPQCHGYNSV